MIPRLDLYEPYGVREMASGAELEILMTIIYL